MRNTHTSQQTNKCSTILFAGFFGIFSNSIDKNLLDAQISGYKKKIQLHQMHTILQKTTRIQHLLHHNYTIFIITIHYL